MRFGPLIAVLVALACATPAPCSTGSRSAGHSAQALPCFSAPPVPVRSESQAIQESPKAGGFQKCRQSQTLATIVIFGDFECEFCQDASELLEEQLPHRHKSYLNVTYRYLSLPPLRGPKSKRVGGARDCGSGTPTLLERREVT